MESFVFFIVGIVLLFLVGKIISLPIKILWKLIVNAVLGGILLLIFNFIGGLFNLSIAINFWTALIAGFFGIPGVIFLVIFKYIL
ncbi:pro-sigmaK processing inhibitor BofA family protein [Clostridium grantii]|uniref:Inhibitor of the pro-sigma K processing machinery n=1 Tax=Clostridium grantii DSM 8605 TaxID=1121316 RepID=A0A1M5XZU3_9CLOT|nr:pro-sigmaK processing inhibitor BofA family protein [Clostridium grantii]SHI05320.1 inhibitor of the pro-sigma K processing machinery [Clostridium grantii DSM 8605]